MKTGLLIAFVIIASYATSAQTLLPIAPPNQILSTINDPELSDYLTRLVGNIVARTNAGIAYTVQVLDDESINAFMQPRGELFLTRGLLNAISNEAELVFVLAQQLSSLQPHTQSAYRRPEFRLSRNCRNTHNSL